MCLFIERLFAAIMVDKYEKSFKWPWLGMVLIFLEVLPFSWHYEKDILVGILRLHLVYFVYKRANDISCYKDRCGGFCAFGNLNLILLSLTIFVSRPFP
jgi:hypothetical protein